ncbi:hypothetical protein [Marinoscillum luteum]|uniref:Uncharacterized protein n=1 Tax=Marinoscillum luteum TaxID=861051 RepID=A0ABW7NCQ1_9BACT
MIYRLYLLSLLFCASLSGLSQEENETEELSKLDRFTSKTGSIIKYQDYSLSELLLIYGTTSEVKVRKIESGGQIGFFLQISNEGKYGDKKASIAYEDLLELIKALEILKSESTNDLSKSPEYLENKFVTDDGFQLGYYCSKGKLQWYLVLESYGSGNTIFPRHLGEVERLFSEAKSKIESLN